MYKTYAQLIRLPTFLDRFNYAKLKGSIGETTFGHQRYLNQLIYNSHRWRRVRDEVIVRDNGYDLAHPDFQIWDRIVIHHLNPITIKDIEDQSEKIFDIRNLICVSFMTHQAIHFGDESLLPEEPIIRKPNDMFPWKGVQVNG